MDYNSYVILFKDTCGQLQHANTEVDAVNILNKLTALVEQRVFFDDDVVLYCFASMPINTQSLPIMNKMAVLVQELLVRVSPEFMFHQISLMLEQFTLFEVKCLINIFIELQSSDTPLRFNHKIRIKPIAQKALFIASEYLVQKSKAFSLSQIEEFEINAVVSLFKSAFLIVTMTEGPIPNEKPLPNEISIKLFSTDFFNALDKFLVYGPTRNGTVDVIQGVSAFEFESKTMKDSFLNFAFAELNKLFDLNDSLAISLSNTFVCLFVPTSYFTALFFEHLEKFCINLVRSINTLNFGDLNDLLNFLGALQKFAKRDKNGVMGVFDERLKREFLPLLFVGITHLNQTIFSELLATNAFDPFVENISPLVRDVNIQDLQVLFDSSPFWYFVVSAAMVTRDYKQTDNNLGETVMANIARCQNLTPVVLFGVITFLDSFVLYRSMYATDAELEIIILVLNKALECKCILAKTTKLIERCCLNAKILQFVQASKLDMVLLNISLVCCSFTFIVLCKFEII
ncbi:hypothetical protein EIN_055120 [Entamoeba invadens IP1]|uniref:hypothetical protein n=1 Tax=Entamoeba invadens IP1 TaxID=370355 RepID=UPI0002C3D0C6|nr:hypothetical protein EIN_055120 [Entamoeba invadens IP1]ELP93207.1 hypothetical protein EIN_055120 [Entamoeba invadens IP1]|eukprot:XP_004259978.1 hypothetical protein EIN_055120 [Entamoeba invadens IP1]